MRELPILLTDNAQLFVWSEQRGNDHSGSYEASGILYSFFSSPPALPFSRRGTQRKTGPFLQISKPWLRWDTVSFCSFLPNMCKYLLSSSWAFRCFKKTTFRQFSYKQCQSSLPLALKKRSLISQFKNFSLGGNIYRKNKWLDNHCWKKRRNVWLKIFIFLNYR